MVIVGQGQLRHHFWGHYVATIAVRFASAEDAATARLALDAFSVSEKNANVLVFHGGDDDLKKAERQLVAAGADAKKIGSLRFSIDFGEPFTVAINPVDYLPLDAEQLPLGGL